MTLHHWFEDQKRFMIITEISTGGELLDLMQKQKKFESFEAAIILKQVLSAMTFMHVQKQIVHRDLKPENILLEVEG